MPRRTADTIALILAVVVAVVVVVDAVAMRYPNRWEEGRARKTLLPSD